MRKVFLDKLEIRRCEIDSYLCIGLDPHSKNLPEDTPEAARDFCINIIKETTPYALAFKPNIAFFEQYGEKGFLYLQQVIQEIPTEIPIILDCKRGDISTTAAAYAKSLYNYFDVEAVTIAPYMGRDSVLPFATGKYAYKGIFLLCKTSNDSSNEFQTLTLTNGKKLYQEVVETSSNWLSEPIHYVVGATDLDALYDVRLRARADSWILAPGVGAQGGDLHSVLFTVRDALMKKSGMSQEEASINLKLLVTVSRDISNNKEMSPKDAAKDYCEKIRSILLKKSSRKEEEKVEEDKIESFQRDFITYALSRQALLFGSFKLKSGRISPYFFNAGKFSSGECIYKLSKAYAEAIKNSGVQFDVLFGPAYKGIPLATAIGSLWYQLYGESKEVCYNRKEAKDHGEGGLIVGSDLKGKRVLIIDDVITAGTAIKETVNLIQKLYGKKEGENEEGVKIVGIFVCLDRQEKKDINNPKSSVQLVQEELGTSVYSIIKMKNLISYLNEDEKDEEKRKKNQEILLLMKKYREDYGVDY